MTKTKSLRKATAVIMAVIMMFAALGIVAFAAGTVIFSKLSGDKGNYTIRVEFTNCDLGGETSGSQSFTLDTNRSCPITFTTTVPQSTITFYKGGTEVTSFTTPTYVSGMPSTLTTYKDLSAGTYTVRVSSESGSKTVSGHYDIQNVSSYISK